MYLWAMQCCLVYLKKKKLYECHHTLISFYNQLFIQNYIFITIFIDTFRSSSFIVRVSGNSAIKINHNLFIYFPTFNFYNLYTSTSLQLHNYKSFSKIYISHQNTWLMWYALFQLYFIILNYNYKWLHQFAFLPEYVWASFFPYISTSTLSCKTFIFANMEDDI